MSTPTPLPAKSIFTSVEAWGFAHWTYIATAVVAFVLGAVIF